MNLKSMTLGEMTQLFKDMGQPAFRAKQVYTWLHRGVRSYEEMTNLPKTLRERLAAEYPIYAPKVVRKQGRHHQVSLAALRRQLRGDGAYALSLWQYGLHLHGGGLPHGLRLLRLYLRRPGAPPGTL